jgi:hypothetical protein
MKFDSVQKIEKPRKQILDFLNSLEKETQIRFDFFSLKGIGAWVTVETHGTSVCMPAEFYWVNIQKTPLSIEMRFWPCEHCDTLTYVNILYKGKDNKKAAARVKKQISKVVPDMDMYAVESTQATKVLLWGKNDC